MSSQGMPPLAERPHTLYRFYTAADVLLYVGITAALPTRLGNHRDEKPWWTTAARITLTHYPDRDSVLEAERRAIKTERPLHNVVHNRGNGHSPIAPGPLPDRAFGDAQHWEFMNLRRGNVRTIPLYLLWEVHCDPISDEWQVHDVTPAELWRVWLTRYPRDEAAEAVFGPGAFRISWFVEGPGTLEGAPFQDLRIAMESWRRSSGPDWDDEINLKYEQGQQFLAHFTWPVHPVTREPLQWSRLPVIDKVWRRDNLPEVREFKGGFIQEATGWKPSPLQPYVNVHHLARMARLYCPEAY